MKIASIVLIAAALGACGEPVGEKPDDDEYAVWAAVIDSLWGERPPARLALDSTSTVYALPGPDQEDAEFFRRLVREGRVAREMVDGLDTANARPARVHPGRLPLSRVRMMPDVVAVVARSYAGRVTLSRVGFDAARQRALVSVSMVCGGICGSGGLFELAREGGRWRIVAEHVAWVS